VAPRIAENRYRPPIALSATGGRLFVSMVLEKNFNDDLN
jgi:hypothetical protein